MHNKRMAVGGIALLLTACTQMPTDTWPPEKANNWYAAADRHHLSTALVFFDGCWNNVYAAGQQPPPIPGVHNSRWVQDPGIAIFSSPALADTLERYVKDILRTFGQDPRVLLWDLYNEPGSFGAGNKSLPLLQEVFRWSREVNPSQPCL